MEGLSFSEEQSHVYFYQHFRQYEQMQIGIDLLIILPIMKLIVVIQHNSFL